ncbi:MAG: TIGR03757 family integrating conjugative element protein [Roseburia sp.]|nr:TIGR03757 family integrating conjugative element protein [Roseburia sp.]
MSKIPNGLTIVYFDDKEKNIYAELPPDKEQAKKLSRLVYREAMTAISTENTADKPQD